MSRPKVVLGVSNDPSPERIRVDIERNGHFVEFVADGDGPGAILGDLAASTARPVEELPVSPVVPTHEGREVLEMFKGVDFMAVVVHQAEGVHGIRLFDDLLIEEGKVGVFFVGRAEVGFAVMTAPDLMEGEAGFEKENSGKTGHGCRQSNLNARVLKTLSRL
jgi:hypothetical protein